VRYALPARSRHHGSLDGMQPKKGQTQTEDLERPVQHETSVREGFYNRFHQVEVVLRNLLRTLCLEALIRSFD
jgi:hypothetical protein